MRIVLKDAAKGFIDWMNNARGKTVPEIHREFIKYLGETEFPKDADLVREETKNYSREQLVDEIIRLRNVWRVDLSKTTFQNKKLREEIEKMKRVNDE